MTSNRIILADLQTIVAASIDWEKFANTTILISGANGFLPAYLVETLLYLNETKPGLHITVIALVRNVEKARKRFASYLNNKSLRFVVADVSDEIKIDGRVDYIIHAASQASPKYYGTDPVGTLQANVLGTINLIKLARLHKVTSFLYFSSGEVYGEVDSRWMPVSEDRYGYIDPMNVRSCYAESKRMGETICVSWHKQYQVPAKIVRPFHTYGPGMSLDDGRVYADFVSNIIKGENIQMKSDGSAKRAFCYLADASIAFFMVLLEGRPAYAYNVGNPAEEHSILSLAKTLCNLYPEKGLQVQELPESGGNNYLRSAVTRNSPDITRISELGWVPVTGIREGFERTIESYSSK